MTIRDLQRLQEQGKIRGYSVNVGKPDSVTLQAAKRSKYGNIKVVVDNIKFDSLKESERYKELKIALQGGAISNLRVHTKWPLIDDPSLKYKLSYESDFDYIQEGTMIVEDVKGWDKIRKQFLLTATFKRKQKLMLRKYNIEIKLV